MSDMSRMVWFIEKHACDDAKNEGHEILPEVYEDIKADLEKHIETLRQTVEGLSKEGKFD